jgi:hypothetical protein
MWPPCLRSFVLADSLIASSNIKLPERLSTSLEGSAADVRWLSRKQVEPFGGKPHR